MNGFADKTRRYTVITTRTCSFDAIFHIYRVLYVDHDNVKTQIDQINSIFSSLVKMQFKDDKEFYRMRNSLLEPLFPDTTTRTNNSRSINCNANITFVIKKVFPEELSSMIIERSCLNCNKQSHSSRQFLPLNLDTFESNGISDLNPNVQEGIRNIPKVSYGGCTCGSNFYFDRISIENVVLIDIQGKLPNAFSVREIPNLKLEKNPSI